MSISNFSEISYKIFIHTASIYLEPMNPVFDNCVVLTDSFVTGQHLYKILTLFDFIGYHVNYFCLSFLEIGLLALFSFFPLHIHPYGFEISI